MEQITERRIITLILRIVGVITIFIGFILVTVASISLIAAKSATSNLPSGMNVNFNSALSNLGFWAILMHLAIAVWGFIMFHKAKNIAELIAKE
ncbi:hypothetical protein ACFLZ8_06335 [Planctomycetota bacterium]